MVSKIATIGIIGLLAASLVGGSAYILLRPDDAEVARNSRPYSKNSSTAALQGSGYQGGRGAQAQSAARASGDGCAGENGAGQVLLGTGETLGEGLADHPVETWADVSGSVLIFEEDELTMDTGEGPITVHLGPQWYWEDQGISLDAGDQVNVSGFYEDDTFEVASVENITTGETVTLRDETGRPLWAGRGQGRGQARVW